jgi:hypothetical protein
MLFFLALARADDAGDTPGFGLHVYEVPARSPLFIRNPDAQRRMAMFWSGPAAGDPSVVVSCVLWGVEYVHRPLLTNCAFPVGEVIRFESDLPATVQVWVLPIHFCAPTTFFYSAALMVWDEFTLTDTLVNGLCLFFSNPSPQNRVAAQIRSKKVNYSESHVQIIKANFEALECGKEKCERELSDRFFVRFVGAKAGLRLLIETAHEREHPRGPCARNSVPVWDGNLSYAVDLPVADEDFICDNPRRLTRKRQQKWLFLACILSFAMLAVFCVVGDKKDRRIPLQLQEGARH